MISSDQISAIKTETLATLVKRDFPSGDFHTVERLFVEFVTSGAGAYEDYASWRHAWRDFVEFSQDEEEADEVSEEVAVVVGYVTPRVPAALLTAQSQMALF